MAFSIDIHLPHLCSPLLHCPCCQPATHAARYPLSSSLCLPTPLPFFCFLGIIHTDIMCVDMAIHIKPTWVQTMTNTGLIPKIVILVMKQLKTFSMLGLLAIYKPANAHMINKWIFIIEKIMSCIYNEVFQTRHFYKRKY